jgi:hypothetical protein
LLACVLHGPQPSATCVSTEVVLRGPSRTLPNSPSGPNPVRSMPSATLLVPRQAQADEAEEHREQGNGRDRGEDGHTIPMTSAGPPAAVSLSNAWPPRAT